MNNKNHLPTLPAPYEIGVLHKLRSGESVIYQGVDTSDGNDSPYIYSFSFNISVDAGGHHQNPGHGPTRWDVVARDEESDRFKSLHVRLREMELQLLRANKKIEWLEKQRQEHLRKINEIFMSKTE